MICHRSKNIPFEEKIKAVKDYLKTEQSLQKIAASLNIYPKTLWRWVRRYEKDGEDGLKRRKLPKKRLPKSIEQQVILLKEKNPALTLTKARSLMNKIGIKISNKGIWQIWKRCGLSKRPVQDPLNPFGITTPEAIGIINSARSLLEKGDAKEAAKILNSIHSLPADQIIKEVPDKILSPRRKLDRLYLCFGEIPFPEYARKAKQIGKSLERRDYIYSSIIANFLELNALGWMAQPQKKISYLNKLASKLQGVKDNLLWFLFYFEQACTYSGLLQIKNALTLIKKCRKLIYHYPYPIYWDCMGVVLTTVGKYKDALLFYKKAFENERQQHTQEQFAVKLAFYGYSMSGEYSRCKKLLIKAKNMENVEGISANYSLTSAHMSFGQGYLADAHRFFLESLKKATKGELINYVYAATVGLASVAMSLNRKNQAKIYITKYLSLMKKYKRDELILQCLSGLRAIISDELLLMPPMYLLNLIMCFKQTMKISDYRKAVKFAQRKGLTGLFHRWIVFFPEVVLYLLEKGKKTELPKAILQFPIFNQKVPVYHIKFLGSFVVFKNHQYLKIKFSPQEQAFLIQMASNAETPEKFIILNNLYQNFWLRSKDPLSLLLHLLASIKKKLKLPGHILGVYRRYGEPRLINHGFYITTDYQDYQSQFIQAKALARVGEWGLARKEYLRAFKLFRGEPLKKNFDEWSLNLRFKILTELETETVNFAKSCIEHNNKKDARKILQKVLKIIPDSEEMRKLSNGLMV